MKKDIKVIMLPGNGGQSPQDFWFPYVEEKLGKLGIPVINKQFPDPVLARAKYWLPFVKELGADKNTILIGYSSGAIAAMRFAEKNKIFGSVLVGTYYTDIGLEDERQSGYFDDSWNWEAIKNNQNWTVIFASTDDPWISIKEPRFVNEQLHSDYREYTNEGHFGADNGKTIFPELVESIKSKLDIH